MPTIRSTIPMITVTDCTTHPPLTTQYHHLTTSIHLPTHTRTLKSLLIHPGRGAIGMNPVTRQLIHRPCSPAFISLHASVTARFLDYYADFYASDTIPMQNLWFHLFDILQEASKLPHVYFHPEPRVPFCDHSKEFNEMWEMVLKVINKVIHGRKSEVPGALPCENVVHYNGIAGLTAEILYRTGQWKAGLKPWQQYLREGSPGFGVGKDQRVYKGVVELAADQEMADAPPPGQGENQNEERNELEQMMGKKVIVEDKVAEMHVPMGGLAIVSRHTQRAKYIAAKFAMMHEGVDAERLIREFDHHSIKLGTTQTYTSLTGYSTTLQNMYPMLSHETPVRHDDYLATLDMYAPSVPMWLVDEGIALCKGTDAFAHPCGNDKFHMCTVTTGKKEKAKVEMVDKGKGKGKQKEKADDVWAKMDWDDLWDDWKLG